MLKQIVDMLAVGDDEPVPMLDRPWVQQMREEPDGRQALAIWLASSRAILTRLAPILKIVRDAAGADPEMAALWETSQQQRLADFTAFSQLLDGKQALRPDLTAQHAADIPLLPAQPRGLPVVHRRARLDTRPVGAMDQPHARRHHPALTDANDTVLAPRRRVRCSRCSDSTWYLPE